jgi:UDPglucose--hexose-1-phosphate uridylyltransferase
VHDRRSWSEGPHRRYNPLLDEWVLCSPQRLERPWQGQTEAPRVAAPPSHDADCPLCPGNRRAGNASNPVYTSTFAFDNDFPALRAEEGEAPGLDDGLLVAQPERGFCRVLCFSPRHDLTLAQMTVGGIRSVVEAWVDEVRSLGTREGIRHVQVFENKGAIMGCSNPHPHGQIWATAHLPSRPEKLLRTQLRYYQEHARDLLGDYLARELQSGERLVCANTAWVALVPFWAVWPFEVMLIPRRCASDLPSLVAEERDALAAILKQLLLAYDDLFDCSFPYTMGWHGCPTDGGLHPSWRVHASFSPPLLRSALVKKFLVGYEMTAEPQRDLTPEAAAARLRDNARRHE